ncbi:MAG: DUF305 domain-containing protein [Roseiflexaceae bacterium]
MKARWVGVTGAVLVLTALALGTLMPSLLPTAFGTTSDNGTTGPGMMSGGMMFGMMGSGMIGSAAAGDPNQPFDQRFLDQMIMHHQGAVMSVQMMIAASARPELRDLAQRITTAQQREIDQMWTWRGGWYGATSDGALPNMMGDGMIGSGMMGGMMNRDQMRQMMGANVDFDRMFLQMMIPHHEAAITMAQQALAQAEHPEIKTLAQSIITTQQTEITEMRGYLRAWYGAQSQ